jgi:Phosphodiester glycosidase
MTEAVRLSRVWRVLIRITVTCLVLVFVAFASLYAYAGTYGFNVLFRRGLWVNLKVAPDDARLSPSMRLALRDPSGAVTAGPLAWRAIATGFEVGELAVIADGGEVDRILLARIDPAHFRFAVRSAPAGNRDLDAWMGALGAPLVINGSYFARDGSPDTPVVSAGARLGPRRYIANHGAFVASPRSVGIRDFASLDWHITLRGAEDAMISYPLLLARDGSSRVKGDPRWLANRSFVGEDHDGRIILGTTAEAFFSLERLAGFLRAAPLDLAIALNLDGGPVACQGIALNGYRRSACGRWELAARDGRLDLLTPVYGSVRWSLPIVLAVFPR